MRNKSKGFTLIEVIMALLVTGILAAMITNYLGSSLNSASSTLGNLRDTLSIYAVMENIHIDYDNNSSLNLAALKTKVGSSAGNPHNNSYGQYNVEYNEYVVCDASSSTTFTGPAGSTLLRVTLTNPQNAGIIVSYLFSN